MPSGQSPVTDFVVFTLVAPMGAFGDLAGHEQRGSGEWPGRSAVLGLVGAALGARRDDQQAHHELSHWKVAVSVLAQGERLRDFHTAQAVPTARTRRPNSRREAIEALGSRDNPVVTRRDYLTDCAYGVALWGGSEPHRIREALNRPRFVPYLGRKSCPLSAPMAPRVVEADGSVEALRHIQIPPYLASQLDPRRPLLVASDEPLAGGREQIRWDEPLDRVAWHFGPRTEHVVRPCDLRADE